MPGSVDIVEIDHTDDAALRSHVEFERAHEPLAGGRPLSSMRRRLGMVDAALLLEARTGGRRTAVGTIHAAPRDPVSPVFAVSVTCEPPIGAAGRALYERMCAWALRRTPVPRLAARVDEADDLVLRFWTGLGFSVVQRHCVLHIDLAASRAAPPPSPFDIVSLVDRPDLMEAAWRIQRSAWSDVPGNDLAMPSFERWSRSFDSGLRPPAGALVALDSSGDALGLTTTTGTVGDPRVANTHFTGVHPAARGRGIALALKQRQVEWCRDAGYGVLETVNHERNAAMRSINERLGFVLDCAVLELEHTLR